MKLTISRIEQVAQDVKAFELRDTAGGALPAFESGAHIELHLSPGLIRRYSLISDPSDLSHYTIAVLHHPGGRGSSLLHERFKAGDTIETEAPRAGFGLVDAPHSILIAGGIGITPILSHTRELARRGASFDVHYAAHSREQMAFRDAVEEYAGRRAFLYISSESRRMDVATILKSPPADSHVYVCGPARLVDSVRTTAGVLGLRGDQIHFESFGPLWIATDQPVHLELALSGLTLDVPVGHVSRNLISQGNCASIDVMDCITLRSEGVVLRAVGDGTVVDSNVVTNVQSGIFINGGNKAQIINNLIKSVDALDGIDIQGTASGAFTNSVIAGNMISHVFPINATASTDETGCGINEATNTGVAQNLS